MIHKHNLHKCAFAVNGCKKYISDRCRHGYSRTETVNETCVDELTDRVVYQRQHCDDLRVVPYNLLMMMDWDSHINVEYSGSGHCVQYLYKYLFKWPAQKKKELKCIQSKSVILMIRLNYSYMDSLYAQWGHCGVFMGIRAIQHLFRLFVVQTPEQLDFIVRSGKISDLQVYYNRPTELENFKYVDF
jgi:hypothetical protein